MGSGNHTLSLSKHIFDALYDRIPPLDKARRVVYANIAAQELFDCGPGGNDLAMSIRHPIVLDAFDRILVGTKK